jgi:uncharacterized protein (TIGR02145 family)
MHKGCTIGTRLSSILLFLTSLSIVSLTLPHAHAEDIIDEVNIAVPIACSMSATTTSEHTSDVINGQTVNNIGTTNLKVICNDNSGYAIYAIGYTDDTYGKTVLTSSTLGSTHDIATATTVTTGTSSWAMKLASVSGTYAPTIVTDFASYHAVPQEYTRVAYHTSSTDTGTNATGSNLTTTYRAYISPSQPAGTYVGQVKYTLVHPYTAPEPVVCHPEGTTIATISCMQDVSSSNVTTILASMTEGQQYTLADSRDNKEYKVAKLRDGNIWMTQNLDHDIVTTPGFYTNENTDIGYNTTTGEYDTATWTPSTATYSSNNHTWNYSYTTPESYDPGDLYWNGTESDYTDWDTYYNSCDYSGSVPVCDESLNPTSTYISSTGIPQYHLGNYYNWTAAVAMNDSSSYTASGTLIEQSICPAGWTLPRIGTGDDTFYALFNEYSFTESSYTDTDNDGVHDAGENALWTSPLYFTAGGDYNGLLNDVGYGGRFWSPVVNYSYYARYAYFDVGGYVNPSDNDGRGNGDSVRCVARPVSSTTSESGGGGGGPDGGGGPEVPSE